MELYRFTEDSKEYWETWDNDDGSRTVHWGILGTEGEPRVVETSLLRRPEEKIQNKIDALVENGFRPSLQKNTSLC